MGVAYRPFDVQVSRAVTISPNFVRLTLTGEDLDLCGATLLDQRVKLVFTPTPDDFAGVPDWYEAWREMPNDERPPMRTYTLRAVRPHQREVDIDFACHGEEGPASSFARHATPGDRVLLVAPDATVDGSDTVGLAWRPGEAKQVLLVGDETAAPAICNILSTLEDDVVGLAVIEVPDDRDAQTVTAPAGVTIRWVPRTGTRVGTDATDLIREWVAKEWAVRERVLAAAGGRAESSNVVELRDHQADDQLLWEEAGPGERRYAWLAGEAGWVTGLRRMLINDYGIERRQLSFMGYWKDGVAAAG